MTRQVNFEIIEANADGEVTLRDLGPWDQFLTITNDADAVVQRVVAEFPNVKRIFYFDSRGDKCELLFANGRFKGFALCRGSFR